MIKILQVIGGLNKAGAETMLMNLYRSIDRTSIQFDFLVYTSEQQDYEEEVVSLGGKVIHMPAKPGWRMIFSIPEIIKALHKYGPYKVIHIHTLLNSVFPLLACISKTNIKRITHSHSTSNATKASIIHYLYENVSKFIIRKLSNVYLACSEEAGVYLYGKKFNKFGKIIKNAVPLEKFNTDYSTSVSKLKNTLGIIDELVIGSIARLEPVKNHDFMLSIANALKKQNIKFKLIFVGKGYLHQSLQARVQNESLSEEVLFLGTRDDIPQLMHLFDVFLMPSLFEGTPVTLIEAQACKLPCIISTNVPEEADLNLGLVKKLPLEQSAEFWGSLILSHNRKTIPDISITDVEQAFINRGYDSKSAARIMENIYLCS